MFENIEEEVEQYRDALRLDGVAEDVLMTCAVRGLMDDPACLADVARIMAALEEDAGLRLRA